MVGKDTPVGKFSMTHIATEQLGYGGDVLKFYEDDKEWYAIHRVWLRRPEEHRLDRLKSDDVSKRVTITHGCVNVMPDVYEKLLNCCWNQEVEIDK